MKLSIVIPAYNEEGAVAETVTTLYDCLVQHNVPHEIVVVNDNSDDATGAILEILKTKIPTLVVLFNAGPGGFGRAVRYGLEHFSGDCVAIVMADLSDAPEDLVRFYRTMQESDYDCVFGSRWGKGGKVYDYPFLKKIMNRIFNTTVKILFGLKYNDYTNSFKLYRKETIDGLKPFLSPHFNLTLELPLKAIVRGYSYTVLPNSWRNRKTGESKLKIKEMGSRYFFILCYCWIEKRFSRGDYDKGR